MRRITVATPGYLKRHGEPKTPEALLAHQTIAFGPATTGASCRTAATSRWTPTPRFTSNSADAALQYAEAGGGVTRVLAYQAAEGLKRGRLKIAAGEIRAAGAADPHRLPDLAPALGQGARVHRSRGGDGGVEVWVSLVSRTRSRALLRARGPHPFFGTTRNVPLARAITAPSALTRHCAKQIVLPVLITSLSIASHWPISAEPTKSTDERDRDERGGPARRLRAAIAHGVVGERGDQAAMDQAAAIGVRPCQPQADDDGLVGFLRVERLPGFGERALAGKRLEAAGMSVSVMSVSRRWLVAAIERDGRDGCITYKVLNGICAGV